MICRSAKFWRVLSKCRFCQHPRWLSGIFWFQSQNRALSISRLSYGNGQLQKQPLVRADSPKNVPRRFPPLRIS